MIFLYILLGILALFILILGSSLKIKIEFNRELNLSFYFGIFKIPDLLLNRKEKKHNKQKKSFEKKNNQDKRIKKNNKNKYLKVIRKKGYYNSFIEITDFLKPVLSALNSFTSKIRINPLTVNIKMTGDDAAKLAIDYGKFCSVYYPAINFIDAKTKCKNINSNVYVDYVSQNSEIYIKTIIKIRLIHAITHSFKIIREFMSFKAKFN